MPNQYGKLTSGERAVWAAVFARECRELLRNPPDSVIGNRDSWAEWELNQTTLAVEVAHHTVLRLRAVEKRMSSNGFPSASDGPLSMLQEVID
jgi:hypothetical protein